MKTFAEADGKQKLAVFLLAALALCVLPFVVQMAGNAWVRIIDIALLYVLLALGLNIVVGYAGLLDLGYVAFYAVGAYMLGLLASPQLTDTFATFKNAFPNGLHTPWWVVIPLGALVAAGAGVAVVPGLVAEPGDGLVALDASGVVPPRRIALHVRTGRVREEVRAVAAAVVRAAAPARLRALAATS